MFLAYQPHLYEQQKRLQREAAQRSGGLTSPSAASITSTLKDVRRAPTANTTNTSSSSGSSARKSSSDGNSLRTRDDTSIESTTSGASNALFNKRRLRRPKTSGHGDSRSTSLSPAPSDDNSNSLLSPNSRQQFLSGHKSYPDDLTARGGSGGFKPGSQDLLTSLTADDAGLKSGSITNGVSLHLHSDWPLASDGKMLASAGNQDIDFMGRSMGVDGLGITSEQSDSHQQGEGRRAELEPVDLSSYPLPIRLGLIHPSQLSRSARKRLCRPDRPMPTYPELEVPEEMLPTQYQNGYYLFTSPPIVKDTKVKSPTLSVGEYSRSDSQQQASVRSPNNCRGRASNEFSPSDLVKRPFVKSHNSDNHTHRWKLDQYFRIHKRKDASRIREHKFHSYPREEACYWWGYSAKALISESLSHEIITSTAGLSVLDWKEGPPSRVLDVGTGTGKWVIETAKQWQETEFIGLDLVPIQTPLDHVQDGGDLQGRISWVVANVLKGLPFPDHSFDHVHIRSINSGIPEDKWEFLLSEVVRVLTPKGQLEILETDWSFFGSPREILTRDLQDLLSGHSRHLQEKMNIWKRRNGKRYDLLGSAVDSMMARRMIKKDIASMIPFHLMSLEVCRIGQGKPRHLPILARSSTHRMKKAKGGGESLKSLWIPEVNDQSFTTRPQIGHPLPPHQFHVADLDTLRMAILVADITRISEARFLIWEELVADSKLIATSTTSTIKYPWNHFGEFDCQMDEWYNDMMDRADLETLLKSTFDWNEAASRLDSKMNLAREDRKLSSEIPPDVDSMNNYSTLTNLGGGSPTALSSSSSNTKDQSSHLINDSENEEEEDGDQDTIRDETPTPNSFKQTTAILAFRTTTVFTARKKD